MERLNFDSLSLKRRGEGHSNLLLEGSDAGGRRPEAPVRQNVSARAIEELPRGRMGSRRTAQKVLMEEGAGFVTGSDWRELSLFVGRSLRSNACQARRYGVDPVSVSSDM